MRGFVRGEVRAQRILLPSSLDDYVTKENPVRIIEVFVDGLDLTKLGFAGMVPATTGRPAYHPATMLKLYLYGYLNRVQSSRRLERETQRNIEVMWLTGRLMPDFKTIADFRKDNGPAIRATCRQFVLLCRRLINLPKIVAIRRWHSVWLARGRSRGRYRAASGVGAGARSLPAASGSTK